MQQRRMGRTGLKVSNICLGTMTFAGQADEATSSRQLEIVDQGGWATGAAALGWGPRAEARMAGSNPWRTPAPTAANRASNDMTP